ncbi:MAG: hypothetical protein V2A73_00645 [Pseudomonadota bacterium]
MSACRQIVSCCCGDDIEPRVREPQSPCFVLLQAWVAIAAKRRRSIADRCMRIPGDDYLGTGLAPSAVVVAGRQLASIAVAAGGHGRQRERSHK